MLMKLSLIFVGAGLGGVLRYWIGTAIQSAAGSGGGSVGEAAFPWGTLVVNVTGCLAMGVLAAMLANSASPHREELRAALLVGVLGGYTTFSSFGRETIDLITNQKWAFAGAYVLASNAAGLAAVWIGLGLGRLAMK